MDWSRALRRSLEEPGMAFRTALALLRGYYYRVKFRLLGRRVKMGKYFKVSGPLDIRGPGMVIFGDNCSVHSTRLRPTTPYTHTPEAVIKFGDRVLLTRTRLGCQHRIEVEDDAGLAECWIIDTDFHSVNAGKNTPVYNTEAGARPISIGRGAWIGQAAMVVQGVHGGA